MNDLLEGIEVEEECHRCHGIGDISSITFDEVAYKSKCSDCKGTGKITRPATLEEIIVWLKLLIPWCEQHPYYENRQALILPSGGRLAVK